MDNIYQARHIVDSPCKKGRDCACKETSCKGNARAEVVTAGSSNQTYNQTATALAITPSIDKVSTYVAVRAMMFELATW